MGFSVSTNGKETVRSEPNVVPLCDVLLVLLIIFMIVTPLIQKGVEDARDPKGYLLYVNQDKVTLETLQNALEEAFLTVSEKKLYLKADQDIEYGVFAEFLWDTIRAAGIESVGIITEKKTEKGD
ncbi:MAG: biopolymer transporter ExbD [Acidobacteria bacterium]|nr:biopolymer transporter ExbD [Acidobacteriota bacterium]